MEKYTNLLINKFLKAKGLEKFDMQSKNDLSLFASWLEELKEAGQEYLDMLDCLRIKHYKDSTGLEINTGYSDSLVKRFDTKIITPYKESFIKPDNTKIIEGELVILQGTPFHHPFNSNILIQRISKSVDTLFIHNPYNNEDLEDWDTLNPCYNQIIGTFGSIYDKDMFDNINRIKAIHDKNTSLYEEYYNTIDGTYLYVIHHDNEDKVRIRTQ